MGVSDHFGKMLVFVLLFWVFGESRSFAAPSAPKPPLLIARNGDELLLPPYLFEVDGGILNTVSETPVDHTTKRSVKAGEWLEYGDSFSIPARMNMYVLFNEGLQWVGGGVFEGKIRGGTWNARKSAYQILLDRGWMKVWAKPTAFTKSLEIKTPHTQIMVQNGVFWINVSTTKTEVYVFSGKIESGPTMGIAGSFYEWGATKPSPRRSEEWDFGSLESRIARLYPDLIKLAHRANEGWASDSASEKYAALRAQGWKKADRKSVEFEDESKK